MAQGGQTWKARRLEAYNQESAGVGGGGASDGTGEREASPWEQETVRLEEMAST